MGWESEIELKTRARLGCGREDCKLGGNIMEPLMPNLGEAKLGNNTEIQRNGEWREAGHYFSREVHGRAQWRLKEGQVRLDLHAPGGQGHC